jgi:hypothetical protein
MYEPFMATTSDFSNPQVPVTFMRYILDGSPMMRIPFTVGCHVEIVVITKEQAMKFFGLVDPNTDKE